MTNVINLPTYEQSEEIKTELESMLKTIIENTGTDFSKFGPFNFQDFVNISAGDTSYKTGINLSGKGYLSAAVLKVDSGGGAGVRITIDGNVVLETTGITNETVNGFLLRDYLLMNSTNRITFNLHGVNLTVTPNVARFIPNLQTDVAFISSQNLFFEKSLIVEFRRTGANTGGIIPTFISGGKAK